MFDMPKIASPQESIIKDFTSTLRTYQRKHGKENVKILDSLNNNVDKMKPLDDSQLIELVCLTPENEQVIRVIHYSQFDLRLYMPMDA